MMKWSYVTRTIDPKVRVGFRLRVLDVMKEALEPAEAPDVRGLLGVLIVHGQA